MELNNRNRATLAPLALFFIAIAFAGGDAHAQARIQIAPQIIEMIVSPGGELREVISFTNAGRALVDVSLELADFDVDELGNPRIFALGTSEVSLSQFLRISPLRARVEVGETARFRLAAKLPDEFDHLRVMLYLVAKPVEMPGMSAQQTVIVPKVGVPVYIESTTSDPASLELDDVELSRSESAADRLQLTLLTRNVGDRIIRPPVTIEVESRDGSFYEVFEPNSGIAPVFPHHTRLWSFSIGPVPTGELKVNLTFPTSRRESFRSTYRLRAAETAAGAEKVGGEAEGTR